MAAPRRWPAASDIAVAAAVWVADVAIFSDVGAHFDGTATSNESVPLVVANAALGCAPLAWRRIAPLPVYAMVWLATAVSVLVPGYQAILALLVALATVAARQSNTYATAALLFALAPIALGIGDEVSSVAPGKKLATLVGGLLVYSLVYGSGWAVGRWAFRNRARAEAAERQRLIAAREAVAAERLRIARELHDIVSHAVTVMVLQAGGAHRVLRHDPDRAEQALAHVRDAGAQAMSELRRMLVVLRRAEPDGDADAQQATLANLEHLIASVHQAGLPVRLRTRGEPLPVDPSVASTAYRVVQEALTNVARHAGSGTDTTVELNWTTGLEIHVHNAPGDRRDGGTGTGHGLIGLRERVEVAGGTITAAPTVDGGFAVTATLPGGDAASVPDGGPPAA